MLLGLLKLVNGGVLDGVLTGCTKPILMANNLKLDDLKSNWESANGDVSSWTQRLTVDSKFFISVLCSLGSTGPLHILSVSATL